MIPPEQQRKPISWRINEWLREISKPPPSRGSFYNWVNDGLVEIAKIGDMTFVLTDPHEFVRRHRVKGAEPEPAEPPPEAKPEPELPAKRDRGRPPGSRNRPGHRAGRPKLSDAPQDPQPLAAASE